MLDYSAFIRERTANFTGRMWVFAKIAEWLGDPGGARCFLLTGEPGSGKTAVSARLCEFSDGITAPPDGLPSLSPGFLSAFHFCTARDRYWLAPHAFAESLARQLAARYPDTFAVALAEKSGDRQIIIHVEQSVTNMAGGSVAGVVIKRLDVSAASPQDAFLRVVREPLEAIFRAGFDRPIVILTDALDEALLYGENSILTLLAETAELNPLVRFLLTSRQDARVERQLSDVRTLFLSDARFGEENRKDITGYLEERLRQEAPLAAQVAGWKPERTAAAIKTMASAADGNFRYAEFLLDEIAQGQRPLTDLNGLPSGLDELYFRSLERVVALGKKDWETVYAPIMGLLSVAQERLSRSQLESFTGLNRRILIGCLGDLRQFIRETEEETPGDGPRYSLYHQSVRDFLRRETVLIGRERKPQPSAFYLPPEEWHGLIAAYYRAGSKTGDALDWRRVDNYGLRYLVAHVIGSAADVMAALTEIIGPAYFQTKSARFGGPRSVLDDLRLAVEAAQRAGDLACLLRWAWMYASLRDRIAQAVSPELLPLYVRSGQVEAALDMVQTLDADTDAMDGRGGTVETRLVAALAEYGRVEEALALARAIPADYRRSQALCETALHIAPRDRARAMEIIGETTLPAPPELCRILAEEPAFLDRAIALARGSAPALEAVARQAAEYDLTRALDIADLIPDYKEESGGSAWTRGGDVVRADIAIRLAATRSEEALTLLARLRAEPEAERARFAIAGILARSDPARALSNIPVPETLARRQGQRKRPIVFVEDSGYVGWSLALASIAASRDKAIEEAVERAWIPSVEAPLPYINTLAFDLLSRIDLLPLRDPPLSRRIAVHVLTSMETCVRTLIAQRKAVKQDADIFQYNSDAIGQLAGAIAVFDLDQALDFLDWAEREMGSGTGYRGNEALLRVIRVVARFDPDGAVRLCARANGYYEHLALVETVRTVSAYDFDRALAITDAVDARFTRTKAVLYGILGERIGPDQSARAHRLLARLPGYIQSESFFLPLYEAAMALSGEMARYDIDRSLALAARYRAHAEGREDLTHALFADVACAAAEHDVERAMELASDLADDRPRAQALLEIARRLRAGEKSLSLLREAVRIMANTNLIILDNSETLADIVCALAPLSPWEALEWAQQVSDHDKARALQAALQAILNMEGPEVSESLIDYLYRQAPPAEEDPMGLRAYHQRLDGFMALLRLLNAEQRERLLARLDEEDTALAGRLRAWHLAETDPTGALAVWKALGYEDIGWQEVVVRMAENDPEGALTLYHAQQRRDSDVLSALFARIARRDPALALQGIEKEDWEFELHKEQAQTEVAEVIAASDWRQALQIAWRNVTEEGYWRGMALQRIVSGLPRDLPAAERRQAYLSLVMEAEMIQDVSARRDVYEALAKRLETEPEAMPDTTARLISGLALGDKEGFLRLLPNLVRLVCKTDPQMPFRLEAELTRVEALIAS